MQGRKHSPEMAEKFLAKLASCGNITKACKAVRLSRSTAFKWKKDDPDFAARWEDAVEAGLDAAEEELYRRAVKGTLKPVYQGGKKVGSVREFSDTCLIFLLKGGRPEKYRERHEVKHEFSKLSDSELIAAITSEVSGSGTPGD